MKVLAIVLATWLIPTICHAVCFKSYWAIDTTECGEFSVNFPNLKCEFGITENSDHSQVTDVLTILPSPGLYPHINVDSKNNIEQINGGVPQNVDMEKHLQKLKNVIEEQIPQDFQGIAVIMLHQDVGFMWRLLYGLEAGYMENYRKISYDLTDSKLDEQKRQELAESQFESAARNYMEKTLGLAKELRPNALWGFDDFPNCFHAFMYADRQCPSYDRSGNDRMEWFWKLQDFIMPYLYLSNTENVDEGLKQSGMRITEAKRLVKNYNPNAKIIFRLDINKQNAATYVNKKVVSAVLRNMIDQDVDGVLLHDSATSPNSAEVCQRVRDHLTNVLGPQIKEDMEYAEKAGKCAKGENGCQDYVEVIV